SLPDKLCRLLKNSILFLMKNIASAAEFHISGNAMPFGCQYDASFTTKSRTGASYRINNATGVRARQRSI
uniref:BAR domain-containing protein n=1 Tax=Parascaris univalens TaxID=6257 RepID=A0A915A2D6_PARUN